MGGGEDLLEDVLRVLAGAQHAAAEGEQPRPVAVEQDLEGVLVAGAQLRDEPLVAVSTQQGARADQAVTAGQGCRVGNAPQGRTSRTCQHVHWQKLRSRRRHDEPGAAGPRFAPRIPWGDAAYSTTGSSSSSSSSGAGAARSTVLAGPVRVLLGRVRDHVQLVEQRRVHAVAARDLVGLAVAEMDRVVAVSAVDAVDALDRHVRLSQRPEVVVAVVARDPVGALLGEDRVASVAAANAVVAGARRDPVAARRRRRRRRCRRRP